MASAAAAIDEAAGPKHVDESLWWNDSFVYLLNDLEAIYSAATPNTEAVDSLLQNLREHHGCLLNLLAFFKLPNSNSKSAVNCPRIIIGKHNIEIKSELRDMALQLSSVLIAMQYFLERQCLLKCTRQLLMYKSPPYAVSPFPQSPDNGSAHPGSNEKQPEFKKRKMKSCPLPSPIVGVDPTSSVDQPVTGVIDGKFDYGYLVTVKLGSDILRGVLYHKPTESSGAQFAGVSCLQDTSVFDPAASEISTCRKKKKDRIKKRDPDHPKPNRSGYNFFFAEQHARLKALHPAKDREISKMIGELWNKLNEDERLVYQDFGLKDKERYKREMQEYKERLKVQPNTNEVLKQQFSKTPDSSDHRLDYPLSIGASPKVADVDVKILSIQSGTTDINISAEQKSSNQENDYKESILKQ